MAKKLKKNSKKGAKWGQGGPGGVWGGSGASWGDARVLGGGPRENRRSLSSPKAEKFEYGKILTDGCSNGPKNAPKKPYFSI